MGVVDPHAVAQLRQALGRLPDPTFGAFLGPLAVGAEIAVIALVAQIERQAAHAFAIAQRQADFGLVALRQKAHVVIQVDLLRRPERRAQAQQ
ncbi:hypothetical protein D3C86_1947720 [compost metagenome]